ncbi:hypothetical protein [Laspinema olomoucense]|uniref:Uncharacterized protein n=1 Tax=Laspinema olomoucense D3b TaxID=2953688 RepID=A0ABT2N3M3_9CYAN|nr:MULTISPECIES: hypothetical protein [unclassified Laspinema]MCT7977290.1 hypothetical protein [Laspinema sp. D3b]MCT7995504.1 hypothetical protein [Laspinema sp. D3c]
MVLQYTNRRGQTYVLHQSTTKTGKPKYYFSLKTEGNLLDSIPEGFEIYENPNSQVYLRKIQPKVFSDRELEIVDQGIKKYSKIKNFIIDVKDHSMIIHLPDQDVGKVSDILSSFGGYNASQHLTSLLTYTPMMRFRRRKDSKNFWVQRWCFRGSVDDWIDLDAGEDLESLVKKYAPHLGQESFYELYGF